MEQPLRLQLCAACRDRFREVFEKLVARAADAVANGDQAAAERVLSDFKEAGRALHQEVHQLGMNVLNRHRPGMPPGTPYTREVQ